VVFIDESGRPNIPKKPSRRKDELFVLASILFNDYKLVENMYESFLNVVIPHSAGNITIKDLANFYTLLTGDPIEIKAGHILNLVGIFSPLRAFRDEKLLARIKEELISKLVSIIMDYAAYVVTVVINKRRLRGIHDKLPPMARDPRLLAIDFLLSRIVNKVPGNLTIVHDEIEEGYEVIIKDYIAQAKRLGKSPINPKLKIKPNYRVISRIEFKNSIGEPGIWAADLVANTVLRKRAGTLTGNAYTVLVSSTKYLEVMYPVK